MKKWALRIAIGMMIVNARAHCGEVAIHNQSNDRVMGQFVATLSDSLILNDDGKERHHFYIHDSHTEFFYIENGQFEFILEEPDVSKSFKLATLDCNKDYQIEFNPDSIWIDDECVWGIKNGKKAALEEWNAGSN